MARYYNRFGKVTGYSVSKKELEHHARQDKKFIFFLLLFGPILLFGYNLFYLLDGKGYHSLISTLSTVSFVGLSFYLLYFYRVVRYFYFGLYTLLASIICFNFVAFSSDEIWGAFFGLLTLALGSYLTHALANKEVRL
jgi:hypothetical protein